MHRNLKLKYFFITTLFIILSASPLAWAKSQDCANLLRRQSAFQKIHEIKDANMRREHDVGVATSQTSNAYGTNVPIARSFEKEGLFYEDIEPWFSSLKPEAKGKLQNRFNLEKSLSPRKQTLTKWLKNIDSLIIYPSGIDQKTWQILTPVKRLEYLLKIDDLFSVLVVNQSAKLFAEEILNYDDIKPGPNAPEHLVVGDDLGSYEVRLGLGVTDRNQFMALRDETENFLGGSIGHQHFFHAWPENQKAREKMAPKYIELLDATTWYLFWRQMKRNPTDIESILTHPYLGVYTRSALDRLYRAVVEGAPKKFNNKFRMVGARGYKANADIPEQGDGWIPDWEMRSGNKSEKREFVENMLEARFSTGDYSGLKDYRLSNFDPSAAIEELLRPHLTQEQIATVKKFEELHPAMSYNTHVLANNHVRNRIISPLLNWGERLPLTLKQTVLLAAQKKYAEDLYAIADFYIKKINAQELTTITLGRLRASAVEVIEELMYQFSTRVRLDIEFEQYLKPQPPQSISLKVKSSGPINVNDIPIGIEYSFRFPKRGEPKSKAQADSHIKALAEAMRKYFSSSSPVETTGGDSHGHGAVVKYRVVQEEEEEEGSEEGSYDEVVWRAEWDGISRYYVDGKIRRAWGGHAEVPSPKFSPQNIDDGIRQVFQAARSMSMEPRRSAGGGHFNFDLEKIMKNYPAEFGARAMANLISYFESNQEMILFMWMHPLRKHAAHPIPLQQGFAQKISEFHGNWTDLAQLLYESRYFNSFVGRKPKYVPLNVTPVMTPIVPEQYFAPLDIRRKESEWFPSFSNDTGRIEARLFDAPTDEHMAALQIKYFRAVLNKTFNSDRPLVLKKLFSEIDYERWEKNPEQWISDAEAHLKELDLNTKEFRWLLWDSYQSRTKYKERSHEYLIYDDYLPPRKAPGQLGRLFFKSEKFFSLAA
ncbi:MAG: hypothetical protein A2Z20_12235 [Bdellovibrionales bacterium RBG_16_40_8]|nr:MAG: hypothetical protein A2Z20_12235 [Bdellovibrionales bacterium RBG_16_40_8]